MAKKKTIDLRSVDPTPVPAGDVNIIYNGTRIGGFSEDTEATLKTGGCRVPGDIYVNYEKNAPAGNVVNITNNSSGTPEITGSGLITSDGVSSSDSEPISIPSGTSKMFLYNILRPNGYRSEFLIASQSDLYSVDLNGATIAYSSLDVGYFFTMNSPTAPITGQTFNVVITDKE